MSQGRKWILDYFSGKGAEIGVWRGSWSEEIYNSVDLEHLVLVDPWKFDDGDDHSPWWGGGIAKSQKDMDNYKYDVYEKFAQVPCISIMPYPSEVAYELFSDNYFDWVYIDGCHLYKYVRDDLNNWYDKVKVDGIISGDDYAGEGVKKAVDEFVKNTHIESIDMRDRQYVLRKVG